MYYQLHGPYNYKTPADAIPPGGIIFNHSKKNVEISNGKLWHVITNYDDSEGLGPIWAYEWFHQHDPIRFEEHFMELDGEGKPTESWYDTITNPQQFFNSNGEKYTLYVAPNKEPKVLRVTVPLSTYKAQLEGFGKY